MSSKVNAGTVFIATGTPVPESLHLATEAYLPGWNIIHGDASSGMDRDVRKAGWNLMFLAADVQAIAWGYFGDSNVRRALRQILARMEKERFNCLQVTDVRSRRFLGLPYVHVSAHPRHLQKSARIHPRAQRLQAPLNRRDAV